MKRSLWSGLAVTVTLSAFAPSARADFASCVGSLRSQAARDGISAKTLDIAFNGLEPDAKLLALQTQQTEVQQDTATMTQNRATLKQTQVTQINGEITRLQTEMKVRSDAARR